MRTLIPLGVGVILTGIAAGAAFLLVSRDAVSWSWPAMTAGILAVMIIFTLFIPANKGGQQLGPRNSWYLTEQGVADFQDSHSSVRMNVVLWPIAAIPLIVAFFVAALRSWGSI